MKRKGFVFYDSFYFGTKDLSDEDRLAVYDAVIKYAIEGEITSLKNLQNSIFSLIKPQLDANNKKYKNGKLGKEFGKLGGEYGKLGGRPKTPQKPPTKPPKNPPNVKEKEKENVLSKDNGVETPLLTSFYVDKLLETFKQYRGFPPTDREPRRVAWNFYQRINTQLKKWGKPCNEQIYTKLVTAMFNYFSKLDWFEHIENLETLKLKSVIFLSKLEEQDASLQKRPVEQT